MSWQGFKSFVASAFSENGSPSSSRMLSFWLSCSSMGLIWWIVRHVMGLDRESAQVWLVALPGVISALMMFAVSPYGIAKIGQTASSVGDSIGQAIAAKKNGNGTSPNSATGEKG